MLWEKKHPDGRKDAIFIYMRKEYIKHCAGPRNKL